MSRVSGKPYFVYVMWSGIGRCFDVGISEDPKKRLDQHNQIPRGWTARFRPWTLIHTERYENYQSARRREIELKRQKSGRGFFSRTGLNPEQFRDR